MHKKGFGEFENSSIDHTFSSSVCITNISDPSMCYRNSICTRLQWRNVLEIRHYVNSEIKATSTDIGPTLLWQFKSLETAAPKHAQTAPPTGRIKTLQMFERLQIPLGWREKKPIDGRWSSTLVRVGTLSVSSRGKEKLEFSGVFLRFQSFLFVFLNPSFSLLGSFGILTAVLPSENSSDGLEFLCAKHRGMESCMIHTSIHRQ